MHWIARLNCGDRAFLFPGAQVEVIHWAYNTQLPDNVPHRHTCFEVCLVGDWGSGIFTVEGQAHPLAPGDLFIARPGVVHQIQNTGSELMELFWVTFALPPADRGGERNAERSAERGGEVRPERGTEGRPESRPEARKFGETGETAALWQLFANSRHLVTRDDGGLRAMWHALRALGGSPEVVGKELQIRGVASALLLTIAQNGAGGPLPTAAVPSTSGGGGVSSLAALAVRYIHDNLNRPLGMDEISAQVHISARHLTRVFKHYTGVAPKAYIETARIDRARHLLKNSELSIKAIAAATGYADVHHFSRVFARRQGASPGAFRKAQAKPTIIRHAGELV